MGVFDDLLAQRPSAPGNAFSKVAPLPAPAEGAFYAPDDGSALLNAIKQSGGVYSGPNVAYRSTFLPVSAMDDGSVRFDSEAGIAPPIAALATGAATAPYEALKDVASGNLERHAYEAFGGGSPVGAQTESSRQDAQADVAGRAAAAAGSFFGPSALEPKPAGALGVFGGGGEASNSDWLRTSLENLIRDSGGSVPVRAHPGWTPESANALRFDHTTFTNDPASWPAGAADAAHSLLTGGPGALPGLRTAHAGTALQDYLSDIGAAHLPATWNEDALDYLRNVKADHIAETTAPWAASEGPDYIPTHQGIADALRDMKGTGPGYDVSGDSAGAVQHHYERAMQRQNAPPPAPPSAPEPIAEAPAAGPHAGLLAHAEKAGMDHQQFLNTMFGDGHAIRDISGSGDSLRLSANLPNGANISRVFKADGSVDHAFFQVPKGAQDAGIAKQLLAQQIPLYQQMGRTQVNVHANIDVGGYAWGRYGFVPDTQSWAYLRGMIRPKLDALQGQIPASEYSNLRAQLKSSDPKTMWSFVDNKTPVASANGTQPLGKHLFLGSNWHGVLDLSDPQTMARFNDYVGR